MPLSVAECGALRRVVVQLSCHWGSLVWWVVPPAFCEFSDIDHGEMQCAGLEIGLFVWGACVSLEVMRGAIVLIVLLLLL